MDDMFAPDDDAQKIGLTVLVALGLVAGFFVATTATGQDYTTVGTASGDHDAYAVQVEEDQRLRFQLEDPESHSEAALSVYDPDDRYFASFELSGDEDAEMIADQPGAWVVFVTEAVDAQIAVQAEGADENATELAPIDVETSTEEIAAQDGGALDETLKLRLEPRPAVVQLEATGSYESLDAAVTTEEGVVHAIEDASQNESGDATTGSAKAAWNPANLVAGTYTVEAQADAFDGELSLVHKSYDRGDIETREETEAPEDPENASAPSIDNATVITTLQEDEVASIPVEDADKLLLATEEGSSAEVYVYNGSDDMHRVVRLDGHHHGDWWGDEEDNRSREAPRPATAVEAPAEEAVVFVDEAYEDSVIVALEAGAPEVEAEPLELEETEATVEHGENATANATLPGGLVDLHVDTSEGVAFEREITVTGPLGEVAHMRAYGSAHDVATWEEHDVDEDRFSDGEMVVDVDQRSMQQDGETTVTFEHYVR